MAELELVDRPLMCPQLTVTIPNPVPTASIATPSGQQRVVFHPFLVEVACREDKCAWWNDQFGCCGVLRQVEHED